MRAAIIVGLGVIGLLMAVKANARNVPSFSSEEFAEYVNQDGTINLDPGFNDALDSVTTNDTGIFSSGDSSLFDFGAWGTESEPWGNENEQWGFQNVAPESFDFESDFEMTTTDELIVDVAEYLKPVEALRLYVYDDVNGKPWSESQKGNPTIGYGHKLKKGEPLDWVITEEYAYGMLLQDVGDHLLPLVPHVAVPLTLNQWIVMVSLAFNAGTSAVIKSQFLKAVNAGDMATAEVQFKDWNKATFIVNGVKVKRIVQGLVNRRASEWALWEVPMEVVMLYNDGAVA